MQLRTYLKLSDLTLDQMLDKLKEFAEPGELDKLSASSISRHASGENFPGARLQDLYAQATDRAVMGNDWVELAKENRQSKQEGQAA